MEDPQISQNGTNVQERGGTLFSWPIFFCFTSIRFSYLVDLTFSGEGGDLSKLYINRLHMDSIKA